MLPVSNYTLLRVVRRRASPPDDRLNVIGIDDWAWRRSHRYGTIVSDLQRRRIVTFLPDRVIATLEAWPAHHPEIAIVPRDRGGGYGEATARASPHATQVADRWHLMENASAAFLDAVRKSTRAIRTAFAATTINLHLLTSAEKFQYEGYPRREETNAAIMKLAGEGLPIKEIVRRTGHSRSLSVRSPVARERTCSARGRARLRPIFPSWTNNGRRAATTGPDCGGGCKPEASGYHCALSASGRHVAGGLSGLPISSCRRCPPPERSPA